MKYNENPSNSSRVVTSGQGDLPECRVTVVNAPKTNQKKLLQYYRRIRHTTQHNAAKEHVVMAIGKA